MKLVKTNENVNRKYIDGETVDEVTSVSFSIVDGDNVRGSMSVTQFNYNINVNGSESSIEANLASAKALLGID